MIKESELRIGNLILNTAGETVRVKNIQEKSINMLVDGDGVSGSYSLDFFTGVPLTPEILEKCGFEKRITDNILFYFHNCGYVDLYVDGGKFISYHFKFEIKPLHQLQNLYFALTGNELEYKP